MTPPNGCGRAPPTQGGQALRDRIQLRLVVRSCTTFRPPGAGGVCVFCAEYAAGAVRTRKPLALTGSGDP